MRKLVLGIIALVSVQFAFVTYMMVLQSPIELTTATVQTEPRSLRPDLAWINHGNNSTDVAPEPEVASPRIEPLPVKVAPRSVNTAERIAPDVSRSVHRVFKPAFSPSPSKAAAPVEFENVVIRYNRDPEISGCEKRDVPKTKKRSYIAKAVVPVVKKPWDWLKAIGSKFN